MQKVLMLLLSVDK